MRHLIALFCFCALLINPLISALAATATNHFSVTAEGKDATHPNFGKGSSMGFVVNGAQGRTLVLVRGNTYTFDVNTGVMHDFYLTTEAVGWGAATLVEGVEGNFINKGALTFTPLASTPDTVYYGCRNHQLMGGMIHVVNVGEEDKFKGADAAMVGVAKANQALPDKNELKQKISFADTLINQSEAAKRILASSNDDAKLMHQTAQENLKNAQLAWDTGNLFEAKTKADTAMTLMSASIRLVPSDSTLRRAKARYDELVDGVKGLQESYTQNYDAIARSSGGNLPKLDKNKIQTLLDGAKTLFEERKYEAANTVLSTAQTDVTDAINKLLAHRTVSYEMKFDSPAAEYEYELVRFASLLESIPYAIDQQQPNEESLGMMFSYIKIAQAKQNQAVAEAKQSNHAAALNSIKAGIEQLETAFKSIGVR
jgi:hypothetical protein